MSAVANVQGLVRLTSVPADAPFANLLSNYQLPVFIIFVVDLRPLNLVICASEPIFICAAEPIFICLQLVQ